MAEGVESEEVLEALSLIGVDFAQGNWVRRAVPLVQIHSVVGSREERAPREARVLPALSAGQGPA